MARHGPLSPAELSRLGGELARALSYLHAAGKRHAALTPDAVGLRPDKGAVLFLDAPEPSKQQGWVPFEAGSGKTVPASDLYQLGATLLFAATGREPCDSGLPTAWNGNAGLRGSLGRLIARLVDPRWDRRPAAATEVARELEDLAAGRLPPFERRRRMKLGVGLTAAFLTGLMVWAPWKQPMPQAARHIAGPVVAPVRSRPAPVASGWSAVPGIHGDVMGLQRGQDQGLWVFTKYEAAFMPDGAPSQGRKTLHEGPSKAAYAAGVGAGEQAFTGGWEGMVLRGSLSGAALPQPPPLGERGRVDAMAWSDSTLYAAWNRRLWTWREGDSAWTQPGRHPPTGVNSILLTREGASYIGASTGLWLREGGGWRRLWESAGSGDLAGALAEDAQGRVLVGTPDGLFTVTREGRITERELRGHKVTAFAEGGDGRLWAGTWDAGLFVREGGTWRPFGYAYGLPSDQVAGVVVDRHGMLWVGLYGSGVHIRDEAGAAAAARAAKPPQRLAGEAFDSPQDAARRHLAEGRTSGAVSRLVIGGRDFVFFDGRQVAPTGPGSLSADGTSARLEEGRWILRRPDGGETVLPAAGSGHVSRSLIDRKGRLHLGFGDGLRVYDSGVWRTVSREAGLDGNPVQDLAEDGAGNIWAATSPPFDRVQRKYLRKNLHRFDGRAWTSWSPDDGLGYWSSFSVRALPDGSVAATTNGGLSIVHAQGVRNYGRDDGLEDAAWSWLSADPSGRILLAGFSKGLAVCDDYKFSRITTRQGLFSDDLIAAAFDGDGRVWLVGRDGKAFIASYASLRAAAR